MNLNGISKIDNSQGQYIVLTDYGMDGLCVSHQCDTAEEAAQWMMECEYGEPQAVLKIVTADINP